MFGTILSQVRATQPVPGIEAYVTQQNHWVIGPYNALKALAQGLRFNEQMGAKFAQSGAVFGRRAGDKAPKGERTTTSFRSAIEGKDPKASDAALARKFAGQRQGKGGEGPFVPRFTDQFDEVAAFYRDKTLEAHHIVEKSILGTLKVNTGALANERAPCVLLVAELHQRLFTMEVAGARGLFTPTLSGEAACHRLRRIYDALYSEPATAELKTIAGIINREVMERKSGSGSLAST